MASLFSQFATSFFNRFMNVEPDTVIEVKIEDYVHYDIVALEPPLCVHTYVDSKKNQNYEIVLQRNVPTGFSLYRSMDFDQTSAYFNRLKDVIPEFANKLTNHLTASVLQEVCNYAKQYPTQNIAHICAYFGYVEYFQQLQQTSLSSQDVSIINSQDEHGRTPLHIAIECQRFNVVQEILTLRPNLRLTDVAGNNFLHFSAQGSGQIVAAICSAIRSTDPELLKQLINTKNQNNFTPLYLACFHDQTECVKELLKNGADVNGASISEADDRYPRLDETNISDDRLINQLSVKDMKNGGTPLHWCQSPEAIEMLSEMNCNLDARNFHGDTALHNMVERGNLSCIITLLSLGADVNAIGANGNTPLHLAVGFTNVTIVQALVVFGANVDAQNGNADTPRHLAAASSLDEGVILFVLHSVGALRCSMKRPDCNEGCAPELSYNGVPPDSPFSRNVPLYDDIMLQHVVKERLSAKSMKNDNRKRQKLLAMDGGGIRGLILIQMLCHFEMVTKRRVVDIFDWIAGTSTGGILALLLSSGYSATECRKIYFRLKDKLFVGRRPYCSRTLEAFLQRYLGQEKLMSQLPEKPRLLIPATLADRFPPVMRCFRNYRSPDELLNRQFRNNQAVVSGDECLWKVARATGAAPTYFAPFETYLDGGLVANNPTMDLLHEFQYMSRAKEISENSNELCDIDVVVSLGTGAIPNIPMETLNFNSLFSITGFSKTLTTIPALLKVLVEQATHANGCVVDRAQAWCSMIRVPFFRVNPPLSEDIPMDETSNIKLINVMWETMAYIFLNPEQMSELMSFLEN